jgi:ArsR family transcriptional regulator, arsenate/arsenite/antimonite-responsive transcriptional repressor / arsenate reductase (thioredoxin)
LRQHDRLVDADRQRRAQQFAALGDPIRLTIVDELVRSDRSPSELRLRVGIESNLLAHHLDVLADAGLIERNRSSGDGRRRYVHLLPAVASGLRVGAAAPATEALFVCTRNSARSQLAASLWRTITGQPATSAGTDPAASIHPGAIDAAARAGLDLGDAAPRLLTPDETHPLVVTVCDRAHEQTGSDAWLHWSIPDPVPNGSPEAFDAVVEELRARIHTLVDDPRAA